MMVSDADLGTGGTGREGPLLDGRGLLCPRCRVRRDILEYRQMAVIEAFEDECNPVLRCPPSPHGCGFIFSPGPSSAELARLIEGKGS